MKEKCLFCDQQVEVDNKNLIATYDCMDHGWYAVSERIHSSTELRTWALDSSQDLVPVIQRHNRSTGRAFPIPSTTGSVEK